MSVVTQEVSTSYINARTDEEILAVFTRGFFGGWVFGLERFVLGLGVWKLFPARFTSK